MSKNKRWTEKELIALYKSGIRNFRQADLRGLSFREEDLLGADFSGADIRSADFTKAKLVGANFRNARMGKTWWSVVWAAVCCIALAAFSTHAFLEIAAPYPFRSVLGVPIIFWWGFLAFEAIAYATLTLFFILKSSQNKRLATSVTAIAVTLVASISIFITTTVSHLVGILVAMMIGALFLGIWTAALMIKHYSKPDISWGVLLLYTFILHISFSYIYISTLSLSNPSISDFLSCLALGFRLYFTGFVGCYFLTASATTFQVNCRSRQLSPAKWVLMFIALLAWFLFNVWLKLTPFDAFAQYIVLSVGGAGLISAILLATHLSLPGNLAAGRFPWVFQGFTSFHQADITGAGLSNVRTYATQVRTSLMKPFHRYWYILALIMSIALSGLLVSQVELDVSSRSQLSPRLAIDLLHNAASLQQRILSLGSNPTQPNDNNPDTKTTKPESVSPVLSRQRANGIALNTDGSMLAVGTARSVTLWDVPSGQLIRSFESYSDSDRFLYFTEDDRHLINIASIFYSNGDAAAASDHKKFEKERREIFLWDIASGEQINKMVYPPYFIKIVDDVAITFGDNQMQQQNIDTGESVQRFPALAQVREQADGWGNAFYLSMNQPILTDLSQDSGTSAALDGFVDKVVTWDLQTGEQLSAFDPEGRGFSTVSPSGKFFAIYYDYDQRSYNANKTSEYLQSRPYSFVDIWDTSSQSIVYTLPTLSGFESLQMSKDDNVLIAYGPNTFQVWDLQQDKTFLFPTALPINARFLSQSLAMSHDGKVIATPSPLERTVFVWQVP